MIEEFISRYRDTLGYRTKYCLDACNVYVYWSDTRKDIKSEKLTVVETALYGKLISVQNMHIDIVGEVTAKQKGDRIKFHNADGEKIAEIKLRGHIGIIVKSVTDFVERVRYEWF